jgi:hypothetical protein|tara:strand:+ start:20 stop:280 length:261 start_codon:yes stop_codon:yes gene_type:complete
MKLRSGKILSKTENHNPIYKSQKDYEKKLKINFKKWKTLINNKILFHYNMSCEDIPDLPYYDYFVEGVPVEQIVEYIKKEFFFYIE